LGFNRIIVCPKINSFGFLIKCCQTNIGIFVECSQNNIWVFNKILPKVVFGLLIIFSILCKILLGVGLGFDKYYQVFLLGFVIGAM